MSRHIDFNIEGIHMLIKNFNDSINYLIDLDNEKQDQYGIIHNLLETDKFIRELSVNVNYLRQEVNSTNKRITYEVQALTERIEKLENTLK